MRAKNGYKKWKTTTCIGKWLKRYFNKRTTRKPVDKIITDDKFVGGISNDLYQKRMFK